VQSFTSHFANLAVIIHLVFGCCWHHRSCEASDCSHSADRLNLVKVETTAGQTGCAGHEHHDSQQAVGGGNNSQVDDMLSSKGKTSRHHRCDEWHCQLYRVETVEECESTVKSESGANLIFVPDAVSSGNSSEFEFAAVGVTGRLGANRAYLLLGVLLI